MRVPQTLSGLNAVWGVPGHWPMAFVADLVRQHEGDGLALFETIAALKKAAPQETS